VSLESDIFDALKGLVSNRCYPEIFPQGKLPVWPAIRYSFVSVVPAAAICGDGGDETADTAVQIDCVAETFAECRELRADVMAAMVLFDPPAMMENSFGSYDAETKTFRTTLDYTVYRSTEQASP
jgi:hypothetical protein